MPGVNLTFQPLDPPDPLTALGLREDGRTFMRPHQRKYFRFPLWFHSGLLLYMKANHQLLKHLRKEGV